MPLDPARIAEVRSWFEKAREDLRAGEHQLAANPPFLSDAAFHAQQAAEKTMKGFLAWHDHTFGKTHNLVELGRACTSILPDLEPVLRSSAPLTEYAWKFRYPGDPDEPTLGEVTEALRVARDVYEAIAARLPAEAIP
jgi:HEPN domain-containing protein